MSDLRAQRLILTTCMPSPSIGRWLALIFVKNRASAFGYYASSLLRPTTRRILEGARTDCGCVALAAFDLLVLVAADHARAYLDTV